MAKDKPSMRREGDNLKDRAPYRWEEIAECLLNPPERWGNKADLPTDPMVCEFCGKPTKWIWWASDPWTWKNLCGRAGDLEICEDCHAWYPMSGVVVIN